MINKKNKFGIKNNNALDQVSNKTGSHCKEDLKLFADTSNQHMHLCDDEHVKAQAIYKGYRGGRCNFAELKCVYAKDPLARLEGHLIRNLKWHLQDMRYSYVLSWVSEE